MNTACTVLGSLCEALLSSCLATPPTPPSPPQLPPDLHDPFLALLGVLDTCHTRIHAHVEPLTPTSNVVLTPLLHALRLHLRVARATLLSPTLLRASAHDEKLQRKATHLLAKTLKERLGPLLAHILTSDHTWLHDRSTLLHVVQDLYTMAASCADLLVVLPSPGDEAFGDEPLPKTYLECNAVEVDVLKSFAALNGLWGAVVTTLMAHPVPGGVGVLARPGPPFGGTAAVLRRLLRNLNRAVHVFVRSGTDEDSRVVRFWLQLYARLAQNHPVATTATVREQLYVLGAIFDCSHDAGSGEKNSTTTVAAPSPAALTMLRSWMQKMVKIMRVTVRAATAQDARLSPPVDLDLRHRGSGGRAGGMPPDDLPEHLGLGRCLIPFHRLLTHAPPGPTSRHATAMAARRAAVHVLPTLALAPDVSTESTYAAFETMTGADPLINYAVVTYLLDPLVTAHDAGGVDAAVDVILRSAALAGSELPSAGPPKPPIETADATPSAWTMAQATLVRWAAAAVVPAPVAARVWGRVGAALPADTRADLISYLVHLLRTGAALENSEGHMARPALVLAHVLTSRRIETTGVVASSSHANDCEVLTVMRTLLQDAETTGEEKERRVVELRDLAVPMSAGSSRALAALFTAGGSPLLASLLRAEAPEGSPTPPPSASLNSLVPSAPAPAPSLSLSALSPTSAPPTLSPQPRTEAAARPRRLLSRLLERVHATVERERYTTSLNHGLEVVDGTAEAEDHQGHRDRRHGVHATARDAEQAVSLATAILDASRPGWLSTHVLQAFPTRTDPTTTSSEETVVLSTTIFRAIREDLESRARGPGCPSPRWTPAAVGRLAFGAALCRALTGAGVVDQSQGQGQGQGQQQHYHNHHHQDVVEVSRRFRVEDLMRALTRHGDASLHSEGAAADPQRPHVLTHVINAITWGGAVINREITTKKKRENYAEEELEVMGVGGGDVRDVMDARPMLERVGLGDHHHHHHRGVTMPSSHVLPERSWIFYPPDHPHLLLAVARYIAQRPDRLRKEDEETAMATTTITTTTTMVDPHVLEVALIEPLLILMEVEKIETANGVRAKDLSPSSSPGGGPGDLGCRTAPGDVAAWAQRVRLPLLDWCARVQSTDMSATNHPGGSQGQGQGDTNAYVGVAGKSGSCRSIASRVRPPGVSLHTVPCDSEFVGDLDEVVARRRVLRLQRAVAAFARKSQRNPSQDDLHASRLLTAVSTFLAAAQGAPAVSRTAYRRAAEDALDRLTSWYDSTSTQ